MKQAIFQALITNLPTSCDVTAPTDTGYTIYYRTRSAFNSVKYIESRDRLTGYINVHNLMKHGVNAVQYVGQSATTTKGWIKLASLKDEQLTNLMQLIIKLASC